MYLIIVSIHEEKKEKNQERDRKNKREMFNLFLILSKFYFYLSLYPINKVTNKIVVHHITNTLFLPLHLNVHKLEKPSWR